MTPIANMTIAELEAESARLASQAGGIKVQLADIEVRLSQVRAEIQKRQRPVTKPEVTEHALLRYIERVWVIDMEAIRRRIMTDTVKAAIDAGAVSVKVDDVIFAVRDRKIVTVINKPDKPRMKRDRHSRGRP